MLRTLRIKNFALIDRIELSLNSGYTVITGETGSGKSILLAALNLILGERADFTVIGSSSDKAIVEADFKIKENEFKSFFQDNDLDFSELTMIRREINTNGKSRAFINDTPVSLNVLKELTSRLVNINSQYNTLELKSKSYQLEVVDTLAELLVKRRDFSKTFKKYNEKRLEIESLKTSLSHTIQQEDYNRFQLEELEELNLDQTDFNLLEIELKKAENGEEIRSLLNSIVATVENDNQVLDQLRLLRSNLDKIKGIDRTVDDLSERINSVLLELTDISEDSSRSIDSIEMNPERLQILSESLNKFNHLLKKHNVLGQQDLIKLRENFEVEILNVEDLQNSIIVLEKEFHSLKIELEKEAEYLHQQRLEALIPISKELQSILQELKLPNTKLDFVLTKRDEINQFGNSDVALLFSANIGVDTVPIDKAASGGELSRVMLALQKMISEKKVLPTVLFDEIDTGVSGDVAQKIGSLLQKMGKHFQLLAISHLPQVAAKADHHFKVDKEIIKDRTYTKVNLLNADERIVEIARLMSGEEITSAAIENAKALMN